jgi:hypothetical protein
MERAKFRKRLLTAFLALAFAAGDPFFRFAEGGIMEELEEWANKLVILQGERAVALGLEYLLKSPEEDITKAMEAILAEATRRDTTEVQPEYKSDHEALKDVVWKDITPEATAIYAALILADNNIFDDGVPEYRTPAEGQFIRFSEVYRNRVGNWQTYALAAITANNTQTSDATSTQDTIKSLHDASLAASGYRQFLQSRHQTANFMNQEISKLRTDIQRQIDAETWIAVNERQERSDRRAAFDQAVSRWENEQSAGKGY